MQATSSTREQGVSAIATLQRTRWWEIAYTTVSWDYPLSPAAYYDALLSCGASRSRFLRIAYLSTRNRFTTSASSSPLVSSSPISPASPLDIPPSTLNPTHLTSTTSQTSSDSSHRNLAVRLPPIPPIPPYPLSRSYVRPRSANPMSHTLKRRKPQWPKPPHYHASLLRSPLSHRKGLFRAVLPPNQAVDFFRWDILLGAGISLSTLCQERDWTRPADVDACASVVAESVLAPYEAAAGFFGWHGLGPDVTRRDEDVGDDCCWNEGVGLERDGANKCGSSDLPFEIDEAVVEEGRAKWTRVKEELVGPPGLVLRSVVEDGESTEVTSLSDSAHKGVADAHPPPSVTSRREEVRWDPDIGSRPSASNLKRQLPLSTSAASAPGSSSSSKPERRTDSPSSWWYGPSLHRGPHPTPHLSSFRFLPPPSVHCGPPPPQFSPWFPGGRVAPAQGHGYWYGAQPIGPPSSMIHDPNIAKSLPSHSYVPATPAIPSSTHPTQSPRHSTKPSVGRDDYGSGDKETETDHGYESTTTTTDSDPPPHTPIGTATSHSVEALQLHGDDEVEVHGVEIDAEHAAGSVTIRLSNPTTPVKLLDRFTVSTSPSLSSDSVDSYRDGCESSKAAVVFPSLNGSFCQGSSPQTTVSPSSPGTSTSAKTMTPISSSSLSSSKGAAAQPCLCDEEDSKMQLKNGGLEASACSVPGDVPSFMLSPCAPSSMSPNRGLRKDSQGFWEPVTPGLASSSSLPLSPSEGKMGSRPTVGWIGDKTRTVSGERSGSPGSASSPSTLSAKSRSSSPGPFRVASVGSTCSSSSRPASFSSPTTASTSSFGGSYPSSPSPPNSSSLISPNPTTLLPAFLTTATVKRKKASRTREIVDRLRSSSIDAGKGGAELDSLGWLASPSGGVEVDGKPGKAAAGSNHVAGNHVAGGQPSPSSPSQSGADSASWMGSDVGQKGGQAPGSRSFDSGSPGPGGESHGTTHASPRTATRTNPSTTPFPILIVSQTPTCNFTTPRQSQTGGSSGRDPGVPMPSNSVDGIKKNATVATSPNTRSSGPQLVPSTPNSSTSPSTHHSHHPLPSPTHPTVRLPPPVLGPPPPIVAVAPYPHPMYVPFTQYHVAPAHQGQQGQGTWLAVYPGRPPHMHPLPGQLPVPPPITGMSGMRHVSW